MNSEGVLQSVRADAMRLARFRVKQPGQPCSMSTVLYYLLRPMPVNAKDASPTVLGYNVTPVDVAAKKVKRPGINR